MRLRWGTGIASRGRFTGADKPLEESIPPRPKGRLRDLEKKCRLEQDLANGSEQSDEEIVLQHRKAERMVIDHVAGTAVLF